MLGITIHALEALVLVLAGYVCARAFTLAKRESAQLTSLSSHTSMDDEVIVVEERTPERYEVRLDALKEAQIFAGIQMIPLKREFENLLDPQLLWLREAVALYLIGASDIIAKSAGCDYKTRNKFNALVLSTNLKLNEVELSKVMKVASERKEGSDEEQMIIAGAKAATQWKGTKTVKDSLKLRTRLNDWGVFA